MKRTLMSDRLGVLLTIIQINEYINIKIDEWKTINKMNKQMNKQNDWIYKYINK